MTQPTVAAIRRLTDNQLATLAAAQAAVPSPTDHAARTKLARAGDLDAVRDDVRRALTGRRISLPAVARAHALDAVLWAVMAHRHPDVLSPLERRAAGRAWNSILN